MWVFLRRVNNNNVNIYILYIYNFLLNIIYYLYCILVVYTIFGNTYFLIRMYDI